MQLIPHSSKLQEVCYDIRGPVLDEATKLQHAGHDVWKLNTGNPAVFGFEAPEEVLRAVTENLSEAHGYGDSKGLASAREAVARYYRDRGVENVNINHIYLGNGVSELIQMSVQALLNDGDEVLIPTPDYPLWTASVSLAGGVPVHYRCDEQSDWYPDADDIERRITDRTRALVLINPNNPTGAVYPEELLLRVLEVARRHDLIVYSDEIYDKILYDGVTHTSTAALAPDLLCLTFSGLSKAYLVAGFRSGWMAMSGPRERAAGYIEGLGILASMRLCPNVPSQHAVTAALEGPQQINQLVLPGGRLHEQRDTAYRLLCDIPGVSCVKPKGALYAFPRLDPEVFRIKDDEQMVLDLLRSQHILLVQGTGFNWPEPDHFRLVTLPSTEDLTEAVRRVGDFLTTYSQF